MLDVCAYVEVKGEVVALTEEIKEKVLEMVSAYKMDIKKQMGNN